MNVIKRCRWRQIFRDAVIIAILTAALLLLLEFSLRYSNFGYESSYLVRSSDHEHWRTDRLFFRRFNGPTSFFPDEEVFCRIPLVKEPNAYRIIVTGGSAAAGTPDAAFSFSRILEVLLENAAPDRTFEVYNLAYPGMNSHPARALAQEAADHDADLLIHYEAINELIGPFGLLLFADLPVFSHATWTRLIASARALRLVQLYEKLQFPVDDVLGSQTSTNDTELLWNQIPSIIPTMADTLAANLDTMASVAERHGMEFILCTYAHNRFNGSILSAPKFSSLSDEDKQRWKQLVYEGVQHERDQRWSDALLVFRRASDIFAEHPALLAHRAFCLDKEGRSVEAHDTMEQAAEYAAMFTRVIDGMNEVIRATGEDARSVSLVDIARQLPTLSEDSLPPGSDAFFDDFHFTIEGNYRVACLLFDAIASISGLPNKDGRIPILSFTEVSEALAYTPTIAQRHATMMEAELAGPLGPFALNRFFQQAILEVRHPASATEVDAAADLLTLERAYKLRPNDYYIVSEYALQLKNASQEADATRVLEQFVAEIGDASTFLARIGDMREFAGDTRGAAEAYAAAVRQSLVRHDLPYLPLARTLAESGQFVEAMEAAEQGIESNRRLMRLAESILGSKEIAQEHPLYQQAQQTVTALEAIHQEADAQ